MLAASPVCLPVSHNQVINSVTMTGNGWAEAVGCGQGVYYHPAMLRTEPVAPVGGLEAQTQAFMCSMSWGCKAYNQRIGKFTFSCSISPQLMATSPCAFHSYGHSFLSVLSPLLIKTVLLDSGPPHSITLT